MLSVTDCRKLLGSAGGSYSDKELCKLRDKLYQLAELIVFDFVKGLKKC
jgi:hypothetical protein